MKSQSTDLAANSLDAALHIDQLCDEFEARYRSEGGLKLEEYWERVHDRHRSAALVDLLALEVRLRLEAGEKLDVEADLQRFPQFREEVASVCPETRFAPIFAGKKRKNLLEDGNLWQAGA